MVFGAEVVIPIAFIFALIVSEQSYSFELVSTFSAPVDSNHTSRPCRRIVALRVADAALGHLRLEEGIRLASPQWFTYTGTVLVHLFALLVGSYGGWHEAFAFDKA